MGYKFSMNQYKFNNEKLQITDTIETSLHKFMNDVLTQTLAKIINHSWSSINLHFHRFYGVKQIVNLG